MGGGEVRVAAKTGAQTSSTLIVTSRPPPLPLPTRGRGNGERTDRHRLRAGEIGERLRKPHSHMDIAPDFIAEITLYLSDKGGRQYPIVGQRFGCPCKFDPKDFSGWDFWILNQGEQFSPGETRQFGIKFLSPEAALMFRKVSKFYLWEGRIIGEARSLV